MTTKSLRKNGEMRTNPVVQQAIKNVIDQILSDDEFWSGGIAQVTSEFLTQKQIDTIEISLHRMIFKLRIPESKFSFWFDEDGGDPEQDRFFSCPGKIITESK